MKIQFLGTAAAEGWPGVFCECRYCEKARKLKGKDIASILVAELNSAFGQPRF